MVMTQLFRAAPARRQWIAVAAAALLAALPATARADDSAETIRLAVGGVATFALKENPSTGYRWHLDTAASRQLDLIEISDAGYVQGGGTDVVRQPMVGVPGTRSFRIVARRPGTATAVFDYLRDWEKLGPEQRHTVTVEIGAP
jgi:inhibitor of cysteine peptidase